MVDLVKIRKKAKEKAAARNEPAQEAPATQPEAPAAAHPAKRPAAPEPKAAEPAPTKQPKKKSEAAAAPKSQPVTPPAPAAKPDAEPRQEIGPAAAPPTRKDSRLPDNLTRFLATAGERRVEQARESETSAGAQLELLTFSIAGELYAIPIDNVVEIVTPRVVTKIPNSDPSIVGILSLRGMIVTLIDAYRRLGHRETRAETPDTRVIVVQLDHETLGFSVDRVSRVIKIDAAAVEPHPVVHASEQDESVRGVFRYADSLTILLDLDKLLALAAPAS